MHSQIIIKSNIAVNMAKNESFIEETVKTKDANSPNTVIKNS